jgi:phospholipid/cholesterol/gamma-HCH transport system substrate-binding protein
MENKSHALAAGLFVLVVTALLVGLGIWLTRDRGNYQSYELSTGEGVAGLQPQAAVRYKGVSVGRSRTSALTARPAATCSSASP